MMSRRRTLPSSSSSRQMMMAWKVSGLSQSPAIIASRPASIRLAMAISPSRDSSSTEPISRRYMRTGSSVRSTGSRVSALTGSLGWLSPASGSSASSSAASPSASSASSFSTTLTPISLNIARMSSICSEVTSSEGIRPLISSMVTKPRFLASLISRLTAASLRSSNGLSGVSPWAWASSFFAGCFAIVTDPVNSAVRRRSGGVATSQLPPRLPHALRAFGLTIHYPCRILYPAIVSSKPAPEKTEQT